MGADISELVGKFLWYSSGMEEGWFQIERDWKAVFRITSLTFYEIQPSTFNCCKAFRHQALNFELECFS